LARELDDRRAEAPALHVRGLAALFTGDLALADTRFDEAAKAYDDAVLHVGLAVLLLVHRGLVALFDERPAEASTLIDEARQICLSKGDGWVLSYALQGAAMVDFVRGDIAGTSRLVTESLGLKRGLNDTLGIAVGMDMLSWVAAAERRFERAATLMGAAHRVWGGVGEPVFGSKNFAALRSQAEEAVRRHADPAARADAYDRGTAFDVEQAIAFALDEPEPVAADVDRVDAVVGLTRRESEVAELVAQGMSNKEIAAALVISQRTAEGHVQRILTKLGFTSRAQVATWVANQRASQGV
jgi:non-specific serine/threonine protein kinase